MKGDGGGQVHLSGHVSVSVCERAVQEWRGGVGKHIYQDMCLYQCVSERSGSGGGEGGGGKHIYQDLCLYQCVCERSRRLAK